MNMKSGPEIRNDDVLQMMLLTKAQIKDMNRVPLFELFKQADQIFEKYNYPCTLAICAEGIEKYPEWVEYIQQNKYRYKIELHGLYHHNYKNIERDAAKRELGRAIDIIEDTFDVKVTTWYPPWGRKGEHPEGGEICKELGIKMFEQIGKVDAKFWLKDPEKYPHVNFHYWNTPQVKIVEKILCRLQERN